MQTIVSLTRDVMSRYICAALDIRGTIIAATLSSSSCLKIMTYTVAILTSFW